MNGFLNYKECEGEKLVQTPPLPWLKKNNLPFPPSKSRDTLDFRTLLAPKTQVLLEKRPFQPTAGSHGLNPQQRRRVTLLPWQPAISESCSFFEKEKKKPSKPFNSPSWN